MISDEELERDLRTGLSRAAARAPFGHPEWVDQQYVARDSRLRPQSATNHRRAAVLRVFVIVAAAAIVLVVVAVSRSDHQRVPISTSVVATTTTSAVPTTDAAKVGLTACGLGRICPSTPGHYVWSPNTGSTVSLDLPSGWQFNDVHGNWVTMEPGSGVASVSDLPWLVAVDQPDLLPGGSSAIDVSAAEAEQRLRDDNALVVSKATQVFGQWRRLTVQSLDPTACSYATCTQLISAGFNGSLPNYLLINVGASQTATIWLADRPNGHLLIVVLLTPTPTPTAIADEAAGIVMSMSLD